VLPRQRRAARQQKVGHDATLGDDPSMRRVVCLAIVTAAGCAATQPPPAPLGPSPPLRAAAVSAVMSIVERAAHGHGVPAELVLGVIQIESSFDPAARSGAGARGLMQLMPRTAASLARRLGRDRYDLDDPEFNIEAGTAYIAYLLRRFRGDLRLTLAAYNAGPVRIQRLIASGQELSAASRRYVAVVLAARDRFARGATPATPIDDDRGMDHDGLRRLVQRQRELYGERPNDPLPEDS
jgi:soluble lytic murein transglycosylase-like protein